MVASCVSPLSTPLSISDPFFGLFSRPPGQWGLVSYGGDKGLIIRGGALFIERSLNLLSSFCGDVVVKERDGSGAVMVPISESRLKEGLALWFWTQLHESHAAYTEVKDSDGDVVESSLLNGDEIDAKAQSLASALYSSIESDSLGTDFQRRYSTVGTEHRMGVLVHASMGASVEE